MKHRIAVIIQILMSLAIAVMVFSVGCSDDGDKSENLDDQKGTQTVAKSDPVTSLTKKDATGEDEGLKMVVAKVNGHEITGEEFEREIDRLSQIYLRLGAAPGVGFKDLKKHALDNLISRELVFQECEKNNLEVDDQMVDEELNQIFPNKEAFKNYLQQANISEEVFRKTIHTNVAIQTFLNEKFYKTISIPEENMRKFYDQNSKMFIQPEVVHASHILILVDRKADEKAVGAARKKIEEIERKIKDGGDFAALAKEYSQCPSKNKGGDLGYFGRNKMVEPFDKVAFSTPPGQTSPIVETQFGFHIIKVHDKKERHMKSFEEVREQICQLLEKQKVDEELDRFIMAVRKNSDIEIFIPFAREDQQARAYKAHETEDKIN